MLKLSFHSLTFVRLSFALAGVVLTTNVVFQSSALADPPLAPGTCSLDVPGDRTRIEKFYTDNCVLCHGADGKGDGPNAEYLPEKFKPRNFVTDRFKVSSCKGRIKDVIRNGGYAYGMSYNMNSHSTAKINEADLSCLADYILEFAKKK